MVRQWEIAQGERETFGAVHRRIQELYQGMIFPVLTVYRGSIVNIIQLLLHLRGQERLFTNIRPLFPKISKTLRWLNVRRTTSKHQRRHCSPTTSITTFQKEDTPRLKCNVILLPRLQKKFR